MSSLTLMSRQTLHVFLYQSLYPPFYCLLISNSSFLPPLTFRSFHSLSLSFPFPPLPFSHIHYFVLIAFLYFFLPPQHGNFHVHFFIMQISLVACHYHTLPLTPLSLSLPFFFYLFNELHIYFFILRNSVSVFLPCVIWSFTHFRNHLPLFLSLC